MVRLGALSILILLTYRTNVWSMSAQNPGIVQISTISSVQLSYKIQLLQKTPPQILSA